MRLSCRLLLGLMLLGTAVARAAEPVPAAKATTTFTLWQLPEQTLSQMMSYVVRTAGGKLIVIDGGTAGDAPYLRDFLASRGNSVEAWFITHPHSDHVDAPTQLLANPQGLKVGTVYASLPEEDWVAKYVPSDDDKQSLEAFREVLKKTGQRAVDLELGQSLTIDGVHIRVLGIRNPELTSNCFNNSSIVLKMWDDTKSILFLGDLGFEGGQKLLKGPYRDQLHAEYVQMAHHGQNGAGEEVYQAIKPKYCLWPAPRWLWDNDAGYGREVKGKGTGRLKTLEVRAWMEKLNVQRHYVSADGLQKIE